MSLRTHTSFYEVEVAIARVEKKYPHLTEDNAAFAIEREEKIELEIKARENRRNTQGSFKKLGRHIRGHVKPNTAKKSSLTRVSVPDDGPEGLCKDIIGKNDLENHLIEIKCRTVFTYGGHSIRLYRPGQRTGAHGRLINGTRHLRGKY
jgi:hypothetical protein